MKANLRRPASIVSVFAVGLLAVAGPAHAVAKKKAKHPGPVVTVSASSPLASFGAGSAIATCPIGTGLVGGGFASQPGPASDPGGIVFESHAVGNSWIAKAFDDSSQPGSVSAEAYCRRNAPVLTQEVGTAPLAGATSGAFGTGTATASCPPGSPAVAGGFSGVVGTTGFVVTRVSRRSADGGGWQASGENVGAAADTITSYAYCANERLGEIPSALATGSGRAAAIVADSSCPRIKVKVRKRGKVKKVKRPTQALSGGFELSAITPGTNYGPLTFASTRTAGGWHTEAMELNGGTGTATGFAYCGR